jgi:hypothetical protein
MQTFKEFINESRVSFKVKYDLTQFRKDSTKAISKVKSLMKKMPKWIDELQKGKIGPAKNRFKLAGMALKVIEKDVKDGIASESKWNDLLRHLEQITFWFGDHPVLIGSSKKEREAFEAGDMKKVKALLQKSLNHPVMKIIDELDHWRSEIMPDMDNYE